MVRVCYTYSGREPVVEVRDDGRASASAAPELEWWQGFDLERERVHILGIELQAGPVDRGYQVSARLPSQP